MADPEVLHTNPNVPQDADGTGSEAIFAGLNDEHAIIVQATTLVGNSETVDGLAEAIVPILPLKLDNRELYLDQSVFNTVNAALAALTARVANNETVIAVNTAAITTNATAINANTAAIAANAAAITALQQQLTVLSQQLHDLAGAIKPSALNPYADANLAGAGAVAMSLGHYAHIDNLASFTGAGGLSASLGKVPKVLFPGNVTGAGALTAAVLNTIAALRATLPGAGQLQVDALVKSLIIKQGDVPMFGAGHLTAPLNTTLQLLTALTGTGVVSAGVSLKLAAATNLSGAGAVVAAGASVLPSASSFSVSSTAWSFGTGAGIGTSNATLNGDYIGQDNFGYAITPDPSAVTQNWGAVHNGVWTSFGVAFTNTDVLNIAFAFSSGQLFLGVNGTYYNSSGTATGPTPSSATYVVAAGTYFAGMSPQARSSATLTINPGSWGGTLDPAKAGTNITLSNGNLSAINTSSGNSSTVLGTVGKTH